MQKNGVKKKKILTDLQLKEKEETGVQGVSPLALQKQTCQKLRKVQVKGLAIQGKKKELYDNQHAKERK